MQQSVVINSQDSSLKNILNQFFEDKGIQAMFEPSASSAILCTIEKDVDMYLLDCSRNMKESLDLLRIIHRIKPALPVVAVCDGEDMEKLKKISEMGLFYRLFKPIQTGELDIMMEALLKYRKRIHQKMSMGQWNN